MQVLGRDDHGLGMATCAPTVLVLRAVRMLLVLITGITLLIVLSHTCIASLPYVSLCGHGRSGFTDIVYCITYRRGLFRNRCFCRYYFRTRGIG